MRFYYQKATMFLINLLVVVDVIEHDVARVERLRL